MQTNSAAGWVLVHRYRQLTLVPGPVASTAIALTISIRALAARTRISGCPDLFRLAWGRPARGRDSWRRPCRPGVRAVYKREDSPSCNSPGPCGGRARGGPVSLTVRARLQVNKLLAHLLQQAGYPHVDDPDIDARVVVVN